MQITAVYADGGVVQVNPSPYGATWAFVHVDESGAVVRERSGLFTRWPDAGSYTNNFAEFLAVVEALEHLPVGWRGDVCSDSAVTLGRFFHGWKISGLPAWLVSRGAVVRNRLDWTACRPVQLDGHPTKAQLAAGVGKRGNLVSAHNVRCDALCGEQASEFLNTIVHYRAQNGTAVDELRERTLDPSLFT